MLFVCLFVCFKSLLFLDIGELFEENLFKVCS